MIKMQPYEAFPNSHAYRDRPPSGRRSYPIRISCPPVVDAAILEIRNCYPTPIADIRDMVAAEAMAHPEIRWNVNRLRAVYAEERLQDMLGWLEERGFDIGFIDGQTGNGEFRFVPSGLCRRVVIVRYPSLQPSRDAIAECDMIASIDGHPVIGEGKSGHNSYRRGKDFDRKVAAYRRALRDEDGYEDPVVLLGIPDNNELNRRTNMRQYLQDAGGRVLPLGASWQTIRGLSHSLFQELSSSHKIQ